MIQSNHSPAQRAAGCQWSVRLKGKGCNHSGNSKTPADERCPVRASIPLHESGAARQLFEIDGRAAVHMDIGRIPELFDVTCDDGGNLGPSQRSALVGRSGDPCGREVGGFRLAAVFYEKDYREALAGVVRGFLCRLQLADSRERCVEKVTCRLHLVGHFQRIVRQRHPFRRYRDLVAREECIEVRLDDGRETGGSWP